MKSGATCETVVVASTVVAVAAAVDKLEVGKAVAIKMCTAGVIKLGTAVDIGACQAVTIVSLC